MSGTASDRGVDISISHSPTCTAQLENQRISRTNSTTHAKQSSRSLRNTSHARARTILNGACSSGASRVWAAQVDAEGEAGVGRGQEEVRVEKEEEGSLQDRRWRNLLVCSACDVVRPCRSDIYSAISSASAAHSKMTVRV